MGDKVTQLLTRLFTELTSQENPNRLRAGLTDLFVRISRQTGEVSIYGDDDELIASTTIFSWIDEQSTEITQEMKSTLHEVVNLLEQRGFWEDPRFERPFSLELVTDDFSSMEELLFLDDEFVHLPTPLLENLEEDLDAFIEKLLKS